MALESAAGERSGLAAGSALRGFQFLAQLLNFLFQPLVLFRQPPVVLRQPRLLSFQLLNPLRACSRSCRVQLLR